MFRVQGGQLSDCRVEQNCTRLEPLLSRLRPSGLPSACRDSVLLPQARTGSLVAGGAVTTERLLAREAWTGPCVEPRGDTDDLAERRFHNTAPLAPVCTGGHSGKSGVRHNWISIGTK